MPTFATQETIIQPKGNLIVEPPRDADHVLGATGPEWDRVNPGGHWTNLIAPEDQKNRFGDTYMCTAFSLCSALEFVYKKRYGEEINLSDIFVGIGSGNERGYGNSKRAPAEFVRTKGFLFENEYPYTQDMTLDQVYAQPSKTLFILAAKRILSHETGYKLLSDNSINSIKDGLEFSPVRVDVEGFYIFNDKGYLKNAGNGFTHELIIFDREEGQCWYAWDSESAQYIKFDWNYNFGSPMIHSIKKKLMQLVKWPGTPAVYLELPQSGELYAIADSMEKNPDGSPLLSGGDLLKTFSGTYGNAAIVHYDPEHNLNHPPFDSGKVKGTIRLRKD